MFVRPVKYVFFKVFVPTAYLSYALRDMEAAFARTELGRALFHPPFEFVMGLS